jgi:hypothetical protein
MLSFLLLPCQSVITNSARLIAEKIDRGGFEPGYDWCVQQLRDAGLTRLANEVSLAKASKFLANKEFEAAINVFKVSSLLSAQMRYCSQHKPTISNFRYIYPDVLSKASLPPSLPPSEPTSLLLSLTSYQSTHLTTSHAYSNISLPPFLTLTQLCLCLSSQGI